MISGIGEGLHTIRSYTSILSKMKAEIKLGLVEQAVLANTCRPKASELKKITIIRKIQTSPSLEGDSQLGMILFVGVARAFFGLSQKQIMDHLSIEGGNEYEYKLGKFEELKLTSKRFFNKVCLAYNHIRFNV